MYQRKKSTFAASETFGSPPEENENNANNEDGGRLERKDDNIFLSQILDNNKFSIALTLRLLSCMATTTYFVPDEYWQSTEVAHHQVFGYGYITWEWKEKIRSYLYPFLFEIYFRILYHSRVDNLWLVLNGPHAIQAILTAFADVSVYKLALKIHGNRRMATYSFVLNLLSWFLFYTGSRTLSNTAEMCFCSIGLSYFPFTCISSCKSNYISHNQITERFTTYYINQNNSIKNGSRKSTTDTYISQNDSTKNDVIKNSNKGPSSVNTNGNIDSSLWHSLTFGGIACIIRPTCLLIWVPLVLLSLCRRVIPFGMNFFKTVLLSVPLLAVLCFGVDFYFYKTFTIVHWNFVEFNIFQNIGVFYGSHPFHWYLSQGIPVVLGLHLVFIIVGIVQFRGHTLCWIMTVFVLIHSLIPHKEFRFLLPLFPIFMCVAGKGFVFCLQYINKKFIIMLLLVTNTSAAVYFSTVHQRGTIAVMDYITRVSYDNDSHLFLMPCHSTPYYSYVHKNVSLKFLTCEPHQTPGYLCESDVFYKHPKKWLEENINITDWSYVIMFDTLPLVIDDYLEKHNFEIVKSFFHTHFAEGNIGNNVLVYMAIKK